MPSVRTEITEIVTGLGMLGIVSVEEALFTRPKQLIHLASDNWVRLEQAYESQKFSDEFDASWSNGQEFLKAEEGLRRRTPLRIEWKGNQQQPAYDTLPADLRIDYVFLVSCKYLSRVLINASPPHLFDRVLERRNSPAVVDWYMEVASEDYARFYSDVRDCLASEVSLPISLTDLTRGQRKEIGRLCRRRWPDSLLESYHSFSYAVAIESCRRWERALQGLGEREVLLWRMLRLNSAPYFVLGASRAGALRLRIATPWDWRQRYHLLDFTFSAAHDAGQPTVRWEATVLNIENETNVRVQGHVEIRWSHGRFCGPPEAKVYLDTPFRDVPGYFPLR